jgi:hypothetical protein
MRNKRMLEETDPVIRKQRLDEMRGTHKFGFGQKWL